MKKLVFTLYTDGCDVYSGYQGNAKEVITDGFYEIKGLLSEKVLTEIIGDNKIKDISLDITYSASAIDDNGDEIEEVGKDFEYIHDVANDYDLEYSEAYIVGIVECKIIVVEDVVKQLIVYLNKVFGNAIQKDTVDILEA